MAFHQYRFVVKDGLDGNNITIINVADPVDDQDVATKRYVDSLHNSSVPGGLDAQVQFNSAGSFAGSPDFTWTESTSTLNVAFFSGDGSAVTNLNGSNVTLGIVAPERLGSGTPSGSTFLRGDGTWVALSQSGGVYTAGTGIDITDNVISSLVHSDGTLGEFKVQCSDGHGGFVGIPLPSAPLQVLTSNNVGLPSWEPPQVSGGTITSLDIDGGETGLVAHGGPITTAGVFLLDGTLAIGHGGTGGTTVKEATTNLLPDQTGHLGATLTTDGTGNLSWVVQPGTAYLPGVGISFDSIVINSTVADNTGARNLVQISNGDGTLSNVPIGAAGYVLTSNGSHAPSWENVSGTVTDIVIVRDPERGLFISGGDDYQPTPADFAKHITTTGTLSLAGVLSVKYGGTGATEPKYAVANLLPDQTGQSGHVLYTSGDGVYWDLPIPPQGGNAGKFLSTDGHTASWITPAGGGTVTSIDVDGGTTGITVSGGPITQSGTLTLGGVLAVANGGTGAATASDALKHILPDQAGNAGLILGTNGTDATWVSTGAGSVTSIDIDGGVTGLSFANGPITDHGTFAVGGVLAIAHGGTGATQADHAINALLPAQTSNGGKVLGTDGQNVAWITNQANLGTVTSVNVSGGTTGLTFTDGPITDAGTITAGGILAIANGGTGAATAAAALTALLPDQSASSGYVLSTNGTTASWMSIGAGTVLSVDIDPGVTGLTFAGGPITSSGTFHVSGILALTNGGTGGTSAITARTNILPPQITHAGQVLTTDGTDVSWTVLSSLGSNAVGSTGQIQFNTSGSLDSSSGLTWSTSTSTLVATNISGNGSGITALNATALTAGTVSPSRLGSGTANSTTFLRGDNTWVTVGGVSSVDVSGGTTGLTASGGPITTAGTITLAGTLAIANGGTGATTATAAATNILPAQSGSAGKVLVTNGTTASWGTTLDSMTFAMSDEITALTTGTAYVTFRAPFALTLSQMMRASLSTASTSGAVIVDIKVNGTSIFNATKLTIDTSAKTSVGSASTPTYATTSIVDNAEITMDITSAGTGAKGLKVTFYYTKT